MSLQDEAVGLLQQLLRLNTVNPPGNETIAAELLRDYLEANGVEVELYARVPERANLVARLKGGDGPSLCFLSHTDTVVADAAEWSRDPWSGDLADDHVWGRGALDMKNQVAASAVAIASLAREGFTPPGDLVFVAAADEEVGDNYGLQWLCEDHPDAVRVDYAINEGGGERVELGGRVVLPLRGRGEDERALPDHRPRPQRPRLDAGDRRQRARQGGAADREARRLPARGHDRARGRRLPRCRARRAAAGRAGAGAAARARPARRRDDRAAARVHALADDDRGLRAPERDPGNGAS